MHFTTLQSFRQDVYACFPKAKDALFNTVDALSTETAAGSFPELSLSPFFERCWSSLYEAFEDGRIDREKLLKVFADFAPLPKRSDPLWMGIDVSTIERPCSKTSADRTAIYKHNLPECKKPITFGWSFSTVVILPEVSSSWTYVLDQVRVHSKITAVQVALEQLKKLKSLLPRELIVVLDRGYDSLWLWGQLDKEKVNALIRLKRNWCFYRPAPLLSPTKKKQGPPKKDGEKWQAKDPLTYGSPSGRWTGEDVKSHFIEIEWWNHMHMQQARWLEMTVIRVIRPHATNTERDPRESYFVWIGDPSADIAQIALGYVRRFSQEHTYRFEKQSLLWAEPRLRTPEQYERWTLIVAIAHNQILLARDLVEPILRPWENKQRPCTPQQVRRGLAHFLPQLGTPAQPPKPRGKSKGRAKGAKIRKAPRFPVVKKKPELPKIEAT
jgi:hypothetical protein